MPRSHPDDDRPAALRDLSASGRTTPPGSHAPAAVRRLRGPKSPPDPRRPIDVFRERERRLDGTLAEVVTVLIAGAECPFTCVYCDLWRHTLDGPTPRGALPDQLDLALERVESTGASWIKLYNASNWFDRRAVPESDDPALLERVAPFERVVVECHPRLLGARARAWADALGPGGLQVALGLETVDPDAAPALGKGATPADFEHAIADLAAWGASTRVFVLVGLPGRSLRSAVDASEATTRWAVERGVEHVALVPLRSGNGYLDASVSRGETELPTLGAVEDALDRCLAAAGSRAVVTVDTWDLEAGCPGCGEARRARLGRLNLTGRSEPRVPCSTCGGGA